MKSDNASKPIVITRPLGDEIILRDELLDRGYQVIHEPLTDIFLRHDLRMNVEHALLADPDAIIITSKHAVQALALLTEMRDMFLLCVGEATANVASQLGFDRISVTGETVEHLVDYILDCYDEDSRFLYISGEHVTTDLTSELGVRGMEVNRIAVYEAIASEALSDTMVEQLKRGHIGSFTFFSTRSADIFLKQEKKSGILDSLKNIDAFCLSETIAISLGNGGWKAIYHSRKPTLASIVACIDNTYRNIKD